MLLLYFQLWGWAGSALERDPGSEEEAHPRILDWGEWVLQWGWVWERDGGRAQHHHQDYGVQMGATYSTSRWEFSSSINCFFVSFWLAAAAMYTVVLLWIERTLQLQLLVWGHLKLISCISTQSMTLWGSLVLYIRIEYVSKYFYMNVDATKIMDNPEWIVNNDEWESYRRTNIMSIVLYTDSAPWQIYNVTLLSWLWLGWK